MENLNLYFRGFCDLIAVKRELPLLAWQAYAPDISMPIFLSRFFHNKLTIFANTLVRCYFLPLDLFFLIQFIGPLFLILIIYAMIKSRLNKLILLVIALMPVWIMKKGPTLETKYFVYKIILMIIGLFGILLFISHHYHWLRKNALKALLISFVWLFLTSLFHNYVSIENYQNGHSFFINAGTPIPFKGIVLASSKIEFPFIRLPFFSFSDCYVSNRLITDNCNRFAHLVHLPSFGKGLLLVLVFSFIVIRLLQIIKTRLIVFNQLNKPIKNKKPQ